MADQVADEKNELEDSESSLTEEKGNNSTLTKQEKLDKGNALKDEGNAFYKQKDYKNAMKKYHRALLYVKGLNQKHPFSAILNIPNGDSEMSEEFKEKIQQTESSCYNNLAGNVIHQFKNQPYFLLNLTSAIFRLTCHFHYYV